MSVAETTQAPASLEAACFRPGDVVGNRYELLDCIGSGAMGAVYRAHDRVLDADVALKLIRVDPSRSDRDRAMRRLLVEARAIARISHPGIVRVFDFGSTDVVPYIVMELLEGETLGALLDREGVMDAETAVRRILPIADAIAVANRRGVVHRDIKPDNVFLARDEFGRIQPKLVDFGVARLRERGTALTRPGVLMGTPDYMAPEQARAEPDVDQRADVWAFAVVLYELMTGRRPFARENASYLAILKAIVSEPPVPIPSLGAGDAALWTILERALAKRPSDRYSGLRELGEALAGWLLARGVREDAYGVSLRTNWAPGSGPSQRSTDSGAGGRLEPPTLPRAPDQADLALSETLPPPAVPVPQFAPVVVTGENDTRPRFFAKRPPRTLGRTLESASVQRFTPLQIAVASAFAAALATAAIGWAIVRAHLPAPPGVVSAPR